MLRIGAGVRVQVSAGFVLSAGAKAKSVTSNLPILSVLKGVILIFHTDQAVVPVNTQN
jgi:hypothetical protein